MPDESTNAPVAETQLDPANLPENIDPVMVALADSLTPAELQELQNDPELQDPVADVVDPVAEQAIQAATAPVVTPAPVSTPAAPVAAPVPQTDPAIVQTLQAIQMLVQQQAAENAALRQAIAPKPDPIKELAAKLPPEYAQHPEMVKFVAAIQGLNQGGAPQSEVAALRQELQAMKQEAFAQAYAQRNANAVTQDIVGGVLGGQADAELADELRELNFAVGAVYRQQPEQAAARTRSMVERIGKAYAKALAAKTKPVLQAAKAAPSVVPVTTGAQQGDQGDKLELTQEALNAAGGNPVKAMFNLGFGRKGRASR